MGIKIPVRCSGLEINRAVIGLVREVFPANEIKVDCGINAKALDPSLVTQGGRDDGKPGCTSSAG